MGIMEHCGEYNFHVYQGDQTDYSPVHRVTDVFGTIRFGIVSETAYWVYLDLVSIF